MDAVPRSVRRFGGCAAIGLSSLAPCQFQGMRGVALVNVARRGVASRLFAWRFLFELNKTMTEAQADAARFVAGKEARTVMDDSIDAVIALLRWHHASPVDHTEAVRRTPVADIAEALRALPVEEATQIVASLPAENAGAVFDEPELELHRRDIIERLDRRLAARLLAAMAADQQADLLRELSAATRSQLLEQLDDGARASLQSLLSYRPDTAAGIMTTEYASASGEWTVSRVLEQLRAIAMVKETIYAVYVVSPQTRRLEHVVSLRELLIAEPTALVRNVAPKRKLITIPADATHGEAARVIGKYNLLAAPVVDEQGAVLGIVTVDDIIDAMVAEQTGQLQRMGGVEALDLPYTETKLPTMIKKRAGWLCALFLGEMLTATAMGYFEGEIARAVVLSLFIPLIISSGGNSGSQATSLIIRALALQELSLGDWWRVALREAPSGIILGIILGTIGVGRILLWQRLGWYDYGEHYWLVALSVGCSLIGVVTFGALAGSMLPFLLRRIGFDPATASAPFVATLVDVTGLVIYFSVAYLILRGTLL